MAPRAWRFKFTVPTARALQRLQAAGALPGVRHRVNARSDGMLVDHEFYVPLTDPAVIQQLMGLLVLPGRQVLPPWPVTPKDGRDGP